ncbi:MAG: hypothetical protein FWC40_08125 [Proteobacteria bacterium]|nr:hypothetical protein [Pseudomonadota bacterium]
MKKLSAGLVGLLMTLLLGTTVFGQESEEALNEASSGGRIQLFDAEDTFVEDEDEWAGDEFAMASDEEGEILPSAKGRLARSAASGADESQSVVKGHGMQLGMTFLGVPSWAFGIWFAEHGNTWSDTVNMGVSLDYFLRFNFPMELRVGLSWVNTRTGSAFWLRDSHADAPHLADYWVNRHSIIALEAAVYHVVEIADFVDFYYGGGLWGGVILGTSKAYAIRASCAESAANIQTCPHEPGAVSIEGIPPVFGFVMATLGFKFSLLDVMTIRAEGGFKGYFYGQVAVGVEF